MLLLMRLGIGCAAPPAQTPTGSSCSSDAPRSEAPQPRTKPEPEQWFGSHCSCDGWCWENPLPFGGSAQAIWGAGTDDVWVVGDAGFVSHWDGRDWSLHSDLPEVHFRAIWGRAADDVWVGGGSRNGSAEVFHWDGRAWTERKTPHGSKRTSPIVAIGADDNDGIWLADGDHAVWGWSGDGWVNRVENSCPRPAPAEVNLAGWSCVLPVPRSSSGGTIVSVHGQDYWNGVSVGPRPSPRGRTFGGTRPSSVWLKSYLHGGTPELWDGTDWVPIAQTRAGRPLKNEVQGIWGASDDDVWLVGKNGLLLRWNGSELTNFESGTGADLMDVWGSSSDDVWAVGQDVFLHWDGKSWGRTVSNKSGAHLKDVWGTSSCDVWAVGYAGTVLHRNCSGWSKMASGTAADFWGIGGSGSNDVWFVGGSGTILHFDGARLTRAVSPVTQDLYSVWAASRNEAWAVGAEGVLLRWDGHAWTATQSPVKHLRHVHGIDAEHVVAVGGNEIIQWDGQQWNRQRTQPSGLCTGAPVRAFMQTATVLWVTCKHELLWLHWENDQWEARPPRINYRGYFDVAGIGNTVWVAGGAHVSARQCDDWLDLRIPAAPSLRALWASPDGDVWAVGDSGTILAFYGSRREDPRLGGKCSSPVR